MAFNELVNGESPTEFRFYNHSNGIICVLACNSRQTTDIYSDCKTQQFGKPSTEAPTWQPTPQILRLKALYLVGFSVI